MQWASFEIDGTKTLSKSSITSLLHGIDGESAVFTASNESSAGAGDRIATPESPQPVLSVIQKVLKCLAPERLPSVPAHTVQPLLDLDEAPSWRKHVLKPVPASAIARDEDFPADFAAFADLEEMQTAIRNSFNCEGEDAEESDEEVLIQERLSLLEASILQKSHQVDVQEVCSRMIPSFTTDMSTVRVRAMDENSPFIDGMKPYNSFRTPEHHHHYQQRPRTDVHFADHSNSSTHDWDTKSDDGTSSITRRPWLVSRMSYHQSRQQSQQRAQTSLQTRSSIFPGSKVAHPMRRWECAPSDMIYIRGHTATIKTANASTRRSRRSFRNVSP